MKVYLGDRRMAWGTCLTDSEMASLPYEDGFNRSIPFQLDMKLNMILLPGLRAHLYAVLVL